MPWYELQCLVAEGWHIPPPDVDEYPRGDIEAWLIRQRIYQDTH